MLDYTKTAVNKTVSDIKRIAFWVTVSLQLMMIGFPVYSLFVGKGNMILNILLISTTVLLLVFYILRNDDEDSKIRKKIVKNICKAVRYINKIYGLCISAYSFYIVSEHTTLISVIYSGVMALTLLLSIAFDLTVIFCMKQFELFITAFEADFEFITKPANKVRGIVDFVRGKEQQETEEPSASKVKARTYLDEEVAEYRIQKKIEKAEEKAECAKVRKERIKGVFKKITAKKTKETEPQKEEEKAAN